ncbi:probable RNA-directed DNA polymerase from transposon X-element [Trichonephila clavipes]|uniref:Probable RNA-directed DNA polymerase from transposon X-element n=1 Tax=Trichonephila clavipes TaxID=2585209 RepID=A0A8X6RRQ2_TRICX|nr:probable RNA-directed DNA polymerase from transposon X-element [Trichonephila clavipes]
MTPRCLKCGEAHQTKDCPIDRVETAYCINCQTYGHMANYSKCPYFPSLAKANKLKITTQQLLTASLWQCQRFFRKKRSNIPSLTSSSGVANSDDQKANILASTLQNNFSENKRPGDGHHPIDQEITNTLNNFFDNHPLIPISPTEPDEILNYIKSLKNNKAPGSDLITNKMAFSNNWKNAIVFPIKKPNKNAHFPDSYRPISLLSILSKITEYVILNRLKSFTNDNNFINPNQYGFTRNLSTYHPLLGLTEKITAGFQRGRSTGAVFLDIKRLLTGSGKTAPVDFGRETLSLCTPPPAEAGVMWRVRLGSRVVGELKCRYR